jgi:uncharacterized protein
MVAHWHHIPIPGRSKRRPLELLVVASLAFALGIATALILQYPETRRPAAEVWLEENLRMASTKIAAVDRDGNGLLCDLRVEIRPGKGEIYVPINPLVEIDYQYAQWTAVKVAAEITEVALDGDGVGLAGADVTFYVSALPEMAAGSIQIVGGPSAGAAMAVLTVAAIENVSVRGDVVLTGEVQADGSIGVVGGIYPKAKAAEDGGMSIFLVPQGQYVEVSETRGPFVWTRYEPISVLINHAEEQGWGLEIQEVPTVEAAANLMLEG